MNDVITFHFLGECVSQLESKLQCNREITSAQAEVCIFSKTDVTILKPEHLSFGRNSKIIGSLHKSDARICYALPNILQLMFEAI